MKTLTRRIASLESKRPSQPMPIAIFHRDGESFEQAAARQGITSGRYLSIPEPMTEAAWCEAAKVQQAELVTRTKP